MFKFVKEVRDDRIENSFSSPHTYSFKHVNEVRVDRGDRSIS